MRITTTGTGVSQILRLGEGIWTLIPKWAGSAGSGTLKAGVEGNYGAVNLNGAAVTIAADPVPISVYGGLDYVVDIATHTSALTLIAVKAAK